MIVLQHNNIHLLLFLLKKLNKLKKYLNTHSFYFVDQFLMFKNEK
jgi:hypothetical protein